MILSSHRPIVFDADMTPAPIDDLLDRLRVLLHQTEASYVAVVTGHEEPSPGLFPQLSEIRLLTARLREHLEQLELVLPVDEPA